MTHDEANQTMAYLANELRKAHETAAAQHHVMQQMKAEIDRLKEAPSAGPIANSEEVAELKELISQKDDEILLDSKRIAELEKVLKAVPACEAHGDLCMPHAIEWIERMKALQPQDQEPKGEGA